MTRFFVFVVALTLLGCSATGVKRPYSAFNVAQSYQMLGRVLCCRTEAPVIPGDSHKAYLPKLVAFANAQGIKVLFFEDPLVGIEGMWGMNWGNEIWIRSALPINTQVATLAHEIGHTYQPKGLEPFDNQLFAEVVSIVYCERIGLSVWQSSFVYFGRFDVERHADFIRFHYKEIDAVVDRLLAY